MNLNAKKRLKKGLSAQFLHRWLMLFLAIPLVIWGLTGSYFVLMDIGFIRSDHIVAQQRQPISAAAISYPIAKVSHAYPQAERISLKRLADDWVYHVKLADKSLLINAVTGEQLAAISKTQAQIIAQSFQHQGAISPAAHLESIRLLTQNAPAELASRHLPVWQVVFDDIAHSTLYISAQTGDVVTRRHEYWRLFDLFWKWHIMDYDDGEAIDNQLLFYTAIASFVAVLAGMILVWQRRKRYY